MSTIIHSPADLQLGDEVVAVTRFDLGMVRTVSGVVESISAVLRDGRELVTEVVSDDGEVIFQHPAPKDSAQTVTLLSRVASAVAA